MFSNFILIELFFFNVKETKKALIQEGTISNKNPLKTLLKMQIHLFVSFIF